MYGIPVMTKIRNKSLTFIILIIILLLSYNVLKLGFKELKFVDGKIAFQWDIHYGLLETYTHLYSGTFHIIASIIGIFFFYRSFRGAKYMWNLIMLSFLTLGLVAAGEVFEHYFLNYKGYNFMHYLHMLNAPLGMFFIYMAIREFYEGKRIFHPNLGLFIVILTFLVSYILAENSKYIYDIRIEKPIVYLTLPPTIVFTILLLFIEAKKIFREYGLLVMNISALALSHSLLAIFIVFGRYAHIHHDAWLYVVTHSIQNILHVACGCVILTFAACIKIVHEKFRKIC